MPRSLLLIFPLLTLVACGDSNDAGSSPSAPDAAKDELATLSKLPAKIEEFQPLLKEGDAAKVDDMTTTTSGMKFKVVQDGSGEMPPLGAVIRVHHTGWTIRDGRLGRQITDSRASLEPDRMLLAESMPSASATSGHRNPFAARPPRAVHLQAWLEILQDMRPGERRWVIAPSKLAWGSLGYLQGGVDPDTNIAFDIELVSFRPPAP